MGVLSEVQLIGKALQEAGKIDLYQKLLAIQEKDLELQEENQKLKETIMRLSEELKLKGDLIFKDNTYYLKAERGPEDGPFCSGCWDGKKILVRLHDFEDQYYCPSCRHTEWKRRGSR